MVARKEYLYAEILCDNKFLEGFSNEKSPYYQAEPDKLQKTKNRKLIIKLNRHINNSLSNRQREVIKLLKEGKTERQAAAILRITQQVVHIYKWRAINKLRSIVNT
jgi:DNA-binding NarL/FixJ family response regulator